MGPILSSLVELQAIEFDVRKTKEKLRRDKQAILRQEQKIKQLQGGLTSKQEETKLARMHYDRLDVDLKSREEEVSRLRVALNGAKTNKEYSAILTQINTNKADISRLEDQMLKLMEQIEEDQSMRKEIEGEIDKISQRLIEIRQEVERRQQETQKNLDELEIQHQEASGKVPPKSLHLFGRLAERYDGGALAEVAHTNGRRSEQTCGGCFMSVPLEVVNALMIRDDVMICPNCGRILVMDSQNSSSQTK